MTRHPLLPLLPLLLLTFPTNANPLFQDVTEQSGIRQPPNAEHFGGATIADLDSDGHYDLILTYHNRDPMRIYFGTPNGTFLLSPFLQRADIHGVSVAPRSTNSNDLLLAVSVGGGRGTNPRPPFMFQVRPDRTFTNVTNRLGFGQAGSRGRVVVFFDMSLQTRRQRRDNFGGTDVLVINLLGRNSALTHFAYQNVRGTYQLRRVPGFERVNEERAIVTDIDADGVLELVNFSTLRIFRLVAPFTFEQSTRRFWPRARNLRRSLSGVVELDFNNDGLMDLYLARADSALVTPRGPPSVPETADVLLMNQGGTYLDVSAAAGVPAATDSMGVTAEDFDNNGFVDVLIATFEGPDVLLLNQGDGTFTRVDPRTTKRASARGASVMAMDYDLDGRVDYIVGHGLRTEFFGNFRLMRNVMPLGRTNNYLLVRVGNDLGGTANSINALVTVFLPMGRRMVRRVGGRGAQASGLSLIDTVHFGLGRLTSVRRVTVVWTTRTFQARSRVAANTLVTFGVFN